MKSSSFDINIRLVGKKILKEQGFSLMRDFFHKIGVDNIYVINLDKRNDRRILVEQEMSRYGVDCQLFTAVDGNLSSEAINHYHDYINRYVGKSVISVGAFGYMLTQINIFKDALNKGYKRICVFDDDVFFSDLVYLQLKEFMTSAFSDQWKVILLGASEYSETYPADNMQDTYGVYHPIASKTCGSFANCYDYSVYQDILTATYEMDGVFDKKVLGHIYKQYQNQCFVIYPNICFADVATSDIRGERDQFNHSKLMRWPITRLRYLEYKCGAIRTMPSPNPPVSG